MPAAGLISSSSKPSANSQSGSRERLSDAWLVASAKRGQRPAFDELYKRHAGKMFRTAHRITRNREDAEDAVQECFLNAFVHLKFFGGRSQFSTWLTRIAVNAALMKLRKNRHRPEPLTEGSVDKNQLLVLKNLPPDPSLNPEESYAKCEREAILRHAVATLHPTLRKVVELQLQDRSLIEAAGSLGISLPAVKARLFRARAALCKTSRLQSVVRPT